MLTTPQLIELAKQRLAARHGIPLPVSNYRLHKLTGLGQTTISGWHRGKSLIDISFAPVFADACELPLEFVLASLQHERATDERVKGALERIAEKFSKAAVTTTACAILSLGVGANTLENKAYSANLQSDALYIMRTRRARKKTPAGTPPRPRTLRRQPDKNTETRP